MKRYVKSSWNGTANFRREIENMIDNGTTLDDVNDFIDEQVRAGMPSDDADMLRTFAQEEMRQAIAWKEMINSATATVQASDDIHMSQCSFDFVWDDDYDMNDIKDSVERVIDELGYEVTGIDFYSVDYSSYPEYANDNVSQCSFDFRWSNDYDSKSIESAIESVMTELGYPVIGIDFNSLSFN